MSMVLELPGRVTESDRIMRAALGEVPRRPEALGSWMHGDAFEAAASYVDPWQIEDGNFLSRMTDDERRMWLMFVALSEAE